VRRPTGVLVTGAAALLALSACAGAGGSGNPDRQPADALVPRLSDLPIGWVEAVHTRAGQGRCLPGRAAQAVNTHAVGFAMPRVGQFAAESQTFRTTAQAESTFRGEATSAVAGCVAEVLYEKMVKAFDASDTALVGAPSVAPLHLIPAGDALSAYQVTLTIKTPKRKLPVFVDIAVMRVRRRVATDLIVTVRHAFDPTVLSSLMARVAGRAAGTTAA
jgi:hypothetical protein